MNHCQTKIGKGGMMKDKTSNQRTIETEEKQILENILSIAYGLLAFNKGHRCFDWGQRLYDIHKRLKNKWNLETAVNRKDIKQIDLNEDQQAIFTYCHIDKVFLATPDRQIPD